MAIRTIREMGDAVLEKPCKEVKEMTERTSQLIDDMIETLYDANGVGLAAPQVGILKRIVVIDTTGQDLIVLINPRIIESDGEQTGYEGCLLRRRIALPQVREGGCPGSEYESDRTGGNGASCESLLPRTGSSGWSSLCGEGRGTSGR